MIGLLDYWIETGSITRRSGLIVLLRDARMWLVCCPVVLEVSLSSAVAVASNTSDGTVPYHKTLLCGIQTIPELCEWGNATTADIPVYSSPVEQCVVR
ncbi:MAG: hypothetical protein EOP45_20915 [Sphingobacteriaceae bacterium]|nr:MAG: hypothetical protein EOP45_20915 [Sphingobacteriaceae bacterium]